MASSASQAGVWGAQPVLGLSGDYSSNPALLNLPGTAEEHGALLIDAPTTYVGDAFQFSLSPSFRLSDTRGYSSVDSDYAHLSARGEYDTERSAWSLTVGAARDSSLYRDYLTSGSAGVRRDTGSLDALWDRKWTERIDLRVDASAQRVRYGAPSGVGALTDYRYVSVNPQFVWAATERDKLNFALGAGRYDSLDRTTESRNASADVGFTRALDPLWSVSVTAGYSRALNNVTVTQAVPVFTGNGIAIQSVARRLESSQNGTVYVASLTRNSNRWSVSAQASRQLTPSGFAYLSRQDTYLLQSSYAMTERWTASEDLRRTQYRNPSLAGTTYDLNVTNFDVSAAYRWTRNWTFTASASHVLEHAGSPVLALSTNNFSVLLSRRFDWQGLP